MVTSFEVIKESLKKEQMFSLFFRRLNFFVCSLFVCYLLCLYSFF